MNPYEQSQEKYIVLTVSILSVVLCFGIGTFIWYSNAPFPTAYKMMSAFKMKDIDTVPECIEPKTSQKIELLMSLTGISAEDLMDKLLSSASSKETNNKCTN